MHLLDLADALCALLLLSLDVCLARQDFFRKDLYLIILICPI